MEKCLRESAEPRVNVLLAQLGFRRHMEPLWWKRERRRRRKELWRGVDCLLHHSVFPPPDLYNNSFWKMTYFDCELEDYSLLFSLFCCFYHRFLMQYCSMCIKPGWWNLSQVGYEPYPGFDHILGRDVYMHTEKYLQISMHMNNIHITILSWACNLCRRLLFIAPTTTILKFEKKKKWDS